MPTVTKTLQASLVSPTAHKERKLRDLVGTYREALQEAFEAPATTMSAVNEIVTPYDLPYQAKDALKSYVPALLDEDTYGAEELGDDHPLRLVNRAARFDHSPERAHEFVWQVPQPGRGTNIWIPLQIDPAQEELWHALLNGDASAGQLRLQRHRTSWRLHVTVEFPVEDPAYDPTDGDVTPVGFDVGEAHLLAGCAREQGSPTDPVLVNGGRTRHLRKELHTTLTRLQERDAAEWRIEERFAHYQDALTDSIEKASRAAVEYARRFDKPVVVLEDLSGIREDLDYGAWLNRRLHAWAFARLQGRIEDKAREAGIPVAYVDPEYTSQTCHACGHVGSRNGDEFRCQNEACWVTEYHADINAAVNIGDRLDPWGESLPVKWAGDDIPRDGSPCDGAGTPTEESPSEQMTLGADGSEPTAGS